MQAAIETRGLTKVFGETVAVDHLDLSVESGQVFGFLGPNGAGKTTTIRMLVGLHHPTAGGASLLGFDTERESLAINARCGYLPGELELYPRMSGQRLLDSFARVRGAADDGFRKALVERFEVPLDRPIRELSKGNRQKIGLVLAFMHRPELLVLDEPTSGLDPLMQEEFHALLRETTADGRTVFLSSHELDEVQRVADRVAIIREGRLVITGSVEGLRRQTPQTIEARFATPFPTGELDGLKAVQRVRVSGNRVTLQAVGDLGSVLRVIADHDPIDLVARHADLDELFLTYYRDTRTQS